MAQRNRNVTKSSNQARPVEITPEVVVEIIKQIKSDVTVEDLSALIKPVAPVSAPDSKRTPKAAEMPGHSHSRAKVLESELH
jgi:hypothetical protein